MNVLKIIQYKYNRYVTAAIISETESIIRNYMRLKTLKKKPKYLVTFWDIAMNYLLCV